MTASQWFVGALAAYALLGAIFAAAFVTMGISRVDPVAEGSGAAFRIVVFPGAALLWPVLLKRWIAEGRR